MREMKIKICGLANADNAAQIAAFAPDYVGLIFYLPSLRAVTLDNARKITDILPPTVCAIGVFVDETAEAILNTAEQVGLGAVQLCGVTQIACARDLKSHGFDGKVLGAFAATAENITFLSAVTDSPFDFFLFDTPSPSHGGSGRAFDWDALQNYRGQTPFFLSGGIGPENLADALAVSHPMLCGLDLNSKLEDRPGMKNIGMTQTCIETLRFSANNDACHNRNPILLKPH